jgi:hypothetical protein
MALPSQMVSQPMLLRFIFHVSYLSPITSSHEQLALTGRAVFCDVRPWRLSCRARRALQRASPPTSTHFLRQLTSNFALLLTSIHFSSCCLFAGRLQPCVIAIALRPCPVRKPSVQEASGVQCAWLPPRLVPSKKCRKKRSTCATFMRWQQADRKARPHPLWLLLI